MAAAHVLVVLALLGCHASATTSTGGNAQCPCAAKGSLRAADAPPQVNCSDDGDDPWWKEDDVDCIVATGREGDPLYPADYGDFCKEHKEPGHASCFNLTTGQELPAGVIASWCKDSWCYVDPCACSATSTKSEYFDGLRLAYSYTTCGAADGYTEIETQNDIGDVDYSLWGCSGPQVAGASRLSTSLFAAFLVASLGSGLLR